MSLNKALYLSFVHVTIFWLLVFTQGCSTSKHQVEILGDGAYKVDGIRYDVMKSAVGFEEQGIASWYGPGFDKKPTASGEIYDMHLMTAAHKTLPLPSYVEVTHLENGKSIIVKVNDRGPYHPGRIIDLSFAAAKALGIDYVGTGPVKIRTLPEGDVPLNHQSLVGEVVYIQIGAYGQAATAQTIFKNLVNHGHSKAFIQHITKRELYRVRVGPFLERDSATLSLSKIKALYPKAYILLDLPHQQAAME